MSTTALGDYIRQQAQWRREKAQEFPDDPRNEQSAKALDSLAEYAESDDAREIAALAPHFDGGDGGDDAVFLCVEIAAENSDRFDWQRVEYRGPNWSPGYGADFGVAQMLARYGYGYAITSDGQHQQMLSDLWVACMGAAYEWARQRDYFDRRWHESTIPDEPNDPTGTLSPQELQAAAFNLDLPPQYWELRAAKTEDELHAWIEEIARELLFVEENESAPPLDQWETSSHEAERERLGAVSE